MLLKIFLAFLALANVDENVKLVFSSESNPQTISDPYPPCQRPDGKPGLCKVFQECPLFNNPSDNKYFNANFWRSHCGFQDGLPKVCCPLSSGDKVPEGHLRFVNTTLLPDDDNCGLSIESKIFGGNETELGEFPWMAVLEYKKYSKSSERTVRDIRCGGFLINNRYVLTAAHCIKHSLTYVRLGEHDIRTNPDCNQDGFCAPRYLQFSIEEKIIFPSYKTYPKYHDIALLRLDQNVSFSKFIRPVCLPTTVEEIYKSYVGDNAMVAGWGKTEHDKYSPIKLKVDIPVKELIECEEYLDEGQLCAGGQEGRGSCNVDSGGPLMVTKRDHVGDVHWFTIGVVSGGPKSCATEGSPGHYVRVSKYMTWIVDTIKP